MNQFLAGFIKEALSESRIVAAIFSRRAAFQGLKGKALSEYSREVAPLMGEAYGPALRRVAGKDRSLQRKLVQEVQKQSPKFGPRQVSTTGPVSRKLEHEMAISSRRNPERVREATQALAKIMRSV